MTTQYFINSNWNGKRDYECTNIVMCKAEAAPDSNWIPASEQKVSELESRNIQQLHIQAGVRYYGWL